MSEIQIKSVEDLPKGDIISFTGDKFELSEKLRNDLCVYEISTPGTTQKTVWLLSTRSAFNTPMYMQVEKDVEKAKYKINKKIIVDYSVLKVLYEKKIFKANQKASSDQSIVLGMFEMILNAALVEGVSDIHIEVRSIITTIRMRKDGELTEFMSNTRLSSQEGNSLCAVMYNVLAENQDVAFDPRDCQQGAVPYSIKGQALKLRYQSMPADPDGYDVVLRVLPVGRSEEFIPLQKLGYTQQQVKQLENITSRPVGALIIAGVTGSGKSTTLKNLLMYINASTSYRLKIYTIEDPPEYSIAKVTQIPVVVGKDFDPTKMSPFEKPIKACMRGDPDIIMIGEVRDRTTGDLTKKAVQSGHQVLTTVHAVSALGIIERFQDFGLDGKVLGSPQFLNGLLYQKLLPLTCTKCAVDFQKYIVSEAATKEDRELWKRIKTVVPDTSKYPIKLRSETGCEACSYRGIKGRTVCAEVISIDLKMMKLIVTGDSIDLMFYWRNLSDKDPASENMTGKICMEHGFQKMLNGIVCPREVEREFLPIDEMLLNESDISSYKVVDNNSKKNNWVNL